MSLLLILITWKMFNVTECSFMNLTLCSSLRAQEPSIFHFKYHFYCANLEQGTLFCVWKVEVLGHYWDQLLHFKIGLFMYSAGSGLSCDTSDLRCRMLDLSLHWNFSLLVLHGLHVGSVVAMHRPSCPAACGISVPQPEIELTSPALEGEFLTTGPPGKTSATDYILFYSDTERK